MKKERSVKRKVRITKGIGKRKDTSKVEGKKEVEGGGESKKRAVEEGKEGGGRDRDDVMDKGSKGGEEEEEYKRKGINSEKGC